MTELILGYACINSGLSDIRPYIKVNNSCIAATYRKDPALAISKAKLNLRNVLIYLKWNEEKGIRFYRLSSDMFPHLTNPEFITNDSSNDSSKDSSNDASKDASNDSSNDYAYSLSIFKEELQAIGQYAKSHGHRITMHPGQFCQIGAQSATVFEKTVRELSAHADILDLMGLDLQSVMIVHGGGIYANKNETILRWIEQFHRLPEKVKRRLVIENCEHCYSVFDMLAISEKINRPVVFDTHHHACYYEQKQENPEKTPSEFLPQVIETWTKLGLKPKFHISEQAIGKKIGAHSDFVYTIPIYLLNILRSGQPLDLMIEAKAKEQAVLKLYETYGEFINNRWQLKPQINLADIKLTPK